MVPGIDVLRRYERGWLKGDALAGVAVAAYLVPQVMAYAEIAGVPAASGLAAACGALVVYAVFGSSRQLSMGPESTTALMTAVAVAPLAAGDPARYGTLAAGLAVVVGVLCLLARLLRAGVLADLLSKPVLVGYLAGVAIAMIGSQLGKVTGVEVDGDTVPAQLASFLRGMGELSVPTLLLALALMAFLFVGSRLFPRLPILLLGMVGAAAEALSSLIAELRRRGVVFATARVEQDLRDVLARAGLVEVIGAERMYMTLPTAVAAYREWVVSTSS